MIMATNATSRTTLELTHPIPNTLINAHPMLPYHHHLRIKRTTQTQFRTRLQIRTRIPPPVRLPNSLHHYLSCTHDTYPGRIFAVKICRYNLKGQCLHGSNCTFSHDLQATSSYSSTPSPSAPSYLPTLSPHSPVRAIQTLGVIVSENDKSHPYYRSEYFVLESYSQRSVHAVSTRTNGPVDGYSSTMQVL